MLHKKSLPMFPRGGYNWGMEFTDYMIIKTIIVVIAAAIYGFWRGFTGR
jgi:hypothetical protein